MWRLIIKPCRIETPRGVQETGDAESSVWSETRHLLGKEDLVLTNAPAEVLACYWAARARGPAASPLA